MTFMVWSKALELDIPSIDTQHARLVDLINDLDNAVQAKQGVSVLENVLQQLLEYTENHFQFEEQLLSKHDYPSFPEHKTEHDSLAEKVVFMQDMFKNGQALDTGMLLQFLKVWLQEHILEVDKQYAPYLLEHGAQ